MVARSFLSGCGGLLGCHSTRILRVQSRFLLAVLACRNDKVAGSNHPFSACGLRPAPSEREHPGFA